MKEEYVQLEKQFEDNGRDLIAIDSKSIYSFKPGCLTAITASALERVQFASWAHAGSQIQQGRLALEGQKFHALVRCQRSQ